MKFFRNLLSDKGIEKRYVRAGASFGDAVSYLYMGECIGFEMLLDRWAAWEKEYAQRGYKTVNLDAFVDLGGYSKSIDHLLGQKRKEGEEPVFHAKIYREYREKFLGKIKPAVDLEKMMKDGNQQFS